MLQGRANGPPFALARQRPKAPLRKGSCQKSLISD